jgi:hypothetical protein
MKNLVPWSIFMKSGYRGIRGWGQKHHSALELMAAFVMYLATIVGTIGFSAYFIASSATINSPVFEMDASQYRLWADTINTVREEPGAYLSTNE